MIKNEHREKEEKMKRDIRLIGLDIDGTILNDKKEMTPIVRGAIEKALAAGLVVLPATGRAFGTIPQEILDITGIRYALTANGANVYDRETDTLLFTDYFTTETALAVLDDVRNFQSLITVLIAGQGYADRENMDEIIKTMPPVIVEYLRSFRQPVDDLRKMILAQENPVEKFSIHYPHRAEREKARVALSARKDICITSSLPTNLELNTPTANKGAALLRLGQMLGFRQDQVMAIGDSSNDLDMIKAVGYGVAMGNAEPEVKAVADALTLSCEENGVAHAIEAIL